jgi:hypothetical protein
MQNYSVDQVQLRRRLAEMQARIDADAAQREQERRDDRKAGKLSKRVYNALRACTVPQLLKAKKQCDKFIWDQRHAPSDGDCNDDRPFILKVLLSIPHRNQRFRFEIIRTTKKAEKVYVNGPYWYRYGRDGKVVFRRAVGKKNVRELPRKIKSKLKEYLSTHDASRILQETREKYLRSQG